MCLAGYSCLGKNPRSVNRYVVETAAPGGTVPTFLAASETDPTWTFRNAEADVSRVGAACISKYSEEYSWRQIAEQLEMDHTAVRRAYFREVESLPHDLSQPGDFS
jgi:hypothetical protein